MNSLFDYLRFAAQGLERCGASYALVGGLAIGFRVEARFTRDIDLAVAVDSDAAAEKIGAYFLSSGFELVGELEQTEKGRLATVRLRSSVVPADRHDTVPIVDLLFSACGIEQEVVSGSETIEIQPAWKLKVARREHLIAMKTLSVSDRRPQDEIDLRQLLLMATDAEIAEARRLIDLIISRGFHRDKDLHARLNSRLPRPE